MVACLEYVMLILDVELGERTLKFNSLPETYLGYRTRQLLVVPLLSSLCKSWAIPYEPHYSEQTMQMIVKNFFADIGPEGIRFKDDIKDVGMFIDLSSVGGFELSKMVTCVDGYLLDNNTLVIKFGYLNHASTNKQNHTFLHQRCS